MKIPNRWFDGDEGDGWNFHGKDKTIIRDFFSMGDKPSAFKVLKMLTLKKEWLKDDGEGSPENFDLLMKMREDYFAEIKAGRIKVPVLESTVIGKAWDFPLTLYRQDSAYFERMGGVCTYIISNNELWTDDKDARLKFIIGIKTWWKVNDMRPRARDLIEYIFDYMIDKYQKKPFYQQSLDFVITWLITHKDEWKFHQFYDPQMWYPRGKGQVNWMIHAGDS
jgi:hypothetical protein